MLGDTGGNRGAVTVNDQSVNQAIASAASEIGVGVTQRAQVARVVDQAQVRLDGRAPERPSTDRVGVQDHLLLWGQESARTQNLPGPSSVLGRGQVRMGPCGSFGRELQHLGPQGGQDSTPDRYLRRVEL